MKSIIRIILMPILFASCQYDPYAGNLTTKKPKIADITGTYKFQEQSVYDSPLIKSALVSTITLKSDGTFEVNNMPDLVSNRTGSRLVKDLPLVSKLGKWDMQTIGSVDNDFGKAKPNWGIKLDGMPESLTYIGFMNNSPPYKLIITYDDPDLGQVMIFSKK